MKVRQGTCLTALVGRGRKLLRATGNRDRSTGSRAGFTIIEAIVAFSVLTIGVFSFVGVLISCQSLENVSHEGVMAMNEARRVLEDIRRMPFAEIDEENVIPVFDVSQDGASLTPPLGQQSCGSVNVLPEDPDGMKEIIVTVEWRSITGGQRRIQLACQVSDHL